jgi:hypothetical protein
MTTRTAVPTSYLTHVTTPPFGMSGATGLPAANANWLQIAGTDAVAVGADQRPRNAKLGRPPRGNRC